MEPEDLIGYSNVEFLEYHGFEIVKKNEPIGYAVYNPDYRWYCLQSKIYKNYAAADKEKGYGDVVELRKP